MQALLPDLHSLRQSRLDQFPQSEGVAGGSDGRMEGQDPPGWRQRPPLLQTLEQLRDCHTESGGLIGAAQLGLDLEIAQGTGGLHQWPSQERAACQISGQYQVAGYVLGVQLADAGDNDCAGTAVQQLAVQPEEGEHPVIAEVAAARIQGYGKQELAAL